MSQLPLLVVFKLLQLLCLKVYRDFDVRIGTANIKKAGCDSLLQLQIQK